MESVITRGTTIGGYQVEDLIGQGGMAQVYKAWHTGLHRHEALKILPPQMTFDRSFVERFLNEARTAASLRHPHIATIHTVSQPNEVQPYFAMELVEGGDLSDLLHRRVQLSWEEALPILQQVASALDYAHSHNIIHRDVKPANILLESNGQGAWNVKVVDFGIARAQETGDGARLTKTGMIVGTPEYMSPEQGGSGLPVSQRTDLYSLGVIAYEMLCGHPPFAVGLNGTAMTVIMAHIRDVPRAPQEQVPTLSLAVNNAILKALSKDPADRFESCTAFLDALTGSSAVSIPIAGNTHNAIPLQQSSMIRQKNSSSRWAMIGLLGAVLIGGGMVAVGLEKGSHSTAADSTPITPPPASSHIVGGVSNSRVKPSEAMVKVPDLVGMKQSQAQEFVRVTSLHLEEATTSSSTVPEGLVISQSPDSGKQVLSSATIHVRISSGPLPKQTAFVTPISSNATDIVSARRLTDSDLSGKTDWDLTLMRNTVYARYGYRFHRADLRTYFSGKLWYSPRTDDQNAVHSMFTPVEKYNVEFLSAYSKRHPLLGDGIE